MASTNMTDVSELGKAVKARNQLQISTLLRKGASISELYSLKNSFIEGIAASTLENFLDECITDNKLPSDDNNYYLIFDYTFLSIDDKNQNKIPETGPLYNISECRKLRHLLKHPVFSTFVDLKWKNVQKFYYMNVLMFTVFLLFVNWYVYLLTKYSDSNCKIRKEVPMYIWIILLIFIIYMFLRELFELMTHPPTYIKSAENGMEIAIILLLPLLIAMNNDILPTTSFASFCQLQHLLTAVVPLLCWFELVLLTGRLPLFSIQVEMLKTVSKTFLTYMALHSIIILAFSVSFFTLFYKHPETRLLTHEPFQDIPTSFFKAILMMAGELDADKVPFENANITGYVIFVIFIIFVAMIMLNLLSGLAVSDTHSIKKEAEILSYVSRVKSAFYIESLTLINPGRYNYIGRMILWCFQDISLFKQMGNGKKVYIHPNPDGRISYTNPIQSRTKGTNGNNSSAESRISRTPCADSGIINRAKDILSRKINVDTSINDRIKNIEVTLQKLNALVRNLEDIIVTLLSEQKRN